MPVPSTTQIFDEVMDPTDILDYSVDLSPLLNSGESVASCTVALGPEAVLLGLQVRTTGGYATTLLSNKVTFWLGVADANQTDAAFTNTVTLPIELTLTTDSSPPRRRQRTVAVRVTQR